MEFGLLGPLQAIDGAGPRRLGGPRQRVVLAQLLLRANRVVTQDHLIDAVWGDDPPPSARGSLHTYVSRLRSSLGPDRIEGTRGRYVLHAAPDEIDAVRFEELLGQASGRAVVDPEATSRAYRAALDLWRGTALEDLADEPSLGPEIARLEELRLTATENWVDAELALGRHRELVGELDALAGGHPLRERLWTQLMLALYRSGRQAEALERYRRVRGMLVDELGVNPWPALQRLHEQVLNQDPSLDVVGQPLRGYRLLEEVGEGTFGTVHRAFQPEVGRAVAVKVIRPLFADHPDFIRTFAAEGQLVARLEHPHIVPLYDYWREPDGAYLVTRYLRGGNLRRKLADGPLDPETVVRLIRQIALALAAAHRQGVVHRDLKPANVLFDDEGNAYLADFGMAKGVAVAALRDHLPPAGSTSPLAPYLAPEETRGGEITALCDVYGLGVLVFEALSGRHPFSGAPVQSAVGDPARDQLPRLSEVRPGLPPAVDEVIASALATDPGRRPADPLALADAVSEALGPLLRGGLAPSVHVDARNPYKGLRPFLEVDAPDFHGRRELVDQLVTRLDPDAGADRFLAIVGPSGCGKSSLVRAGLIPALRQGAVPGSDQWFIVDLHPGAYPFEELATALSRVATAPVVGLVERLREDPAGLMQAAAELLPRQSSQLLLVIDQFEEAFTQVGDAQERSRFLQALVTAATDPRSRVRVVVTLRADFFDLPLAHPGIAALMSTGAVSVTPLTPTQLERTIAGPAEGVGVGVEAGLVAALVADVADQAASLPLLQYALTEMFEQRAGPSITLAAYTAVGGVSRALARRAEDLFDRLTPSGQEAARQLFLRLVTLGEQGNRDTRRRVPRAELTGLDGEPEALDEVIDAFGARRLLTFDRDPVTRGPTIEVAHEALLHEWARLRGWIDTARKDVAAHRRLTAAVREWAESGRDDGSLLRGDRLRRYQTWARTSNLALSRDERAYLTASAAARDAELEAAARDHSRQVRRNRQLRVALTAAIGLLAVALLAGALAGRAGRAARAEADRAASEASRADQSAVAAVGARLATTALSAPNPELSLILGRQAVDISDTPMTQGALLNTLMNAESLVGMAQSRVGPSVTTFDHAFTPDGRLLLHMNSRWELDIVDTSTGISLHGAVADSGWGYSSAERNVAAYPSGLLAGGRVAVVSHERPTPTVDASRQETPIALLPIDVRTGEPAGPRQRVPGAVHVFGHDVTDHADRLRISPDGRTLVSVLEGQVRIWHRRGGRWVGPQSVPIPGLASEDTPRTRLVGVTFSASGSRAAVLFDVEPSVTSQEPAGVVVDLKHARLIGHPYLPNRAGVLSHMALSPDGSKLLVGDAEGPVLLRRVADDQVLSAIPGQSPATVVGWSPDGARVAIGRLDGSTEVYSLDPLQRIMTSSGSDRVSAVAFVGDHGLIRESVTGHIARYDLAALSPVATMVPSTPIHALDAAAGIVALGEDDGRVTIRDQQTLRQMGEALTLGPSDGRDRHPDLGAGGRITALALVPDGSAVIAADRLGHVSMWSLPGGELLWARDGLPTSWLAVSPDGRHLATVGNTYEGGDPDGDALSSTFTIWDLGTREVELSEDFTATQFEAQVVHRAWQSGPTPRAVAFSPDSTKVAIAYLDGYLMIYDVAQRRRTSVLPTRQTAPSSMAFSPDSQRLLAATPDYVNAWDANTGEQLLRTYVPGLRNLTRMAYTDDGRWLAVSHPRSVTVLDAQTLRVAAADLRVPTDHPEDAIAMTAGRDHRLIVGTRTVIASIDMDPERWKSVACGVAGRTLTKDEWGSFLPLVPFAPACG